MTMYTSTTIYPLFNGIVYEVLAQSNRDILYGGTYTALSGQSSPGLVRFKSDGTLDEDFKYNSRLMSGSVYSIAQQSDGKLIVGGGVSSYGGFSIAGRLIRLNLDGTLDTDFRTNNGTGSNAIIDTIAIQSDGKILIGGNGFSSWNGATVGNIARLNADGTYDATFTTNVGTGANGSITRIFIQSNGQILVGGSFTTWNGTTVNRIVRLNSDGTRDTTFTTNTGTAAGNGRVDAFAQQSDGKIIVGGTFTTWNGVTVGAIVRLNTDGTRDTVFTTNTGTGTSSIIKLIVLSDNKILLCGNMSSWNGTTANRIIKLNSDGTRDTGFTLQTVNPIGAAESMDINPTTGNIYLVGNMTVWGTQPISRAIILNSSGVRINSETFLDPTNGVAAVSAAFQTDNKMLIGGNFTTWEGVTVNRIVRLNSDGTRDTEFSANVGTGANNTVSVIRVLSSGQIIVAGSFTTWNGTSVGRIVRLNSDGTRDTTFTTNTGTGAANTINVVTVASNGSLYVGGTFTTWNAVSATGIVKLSSAGVRDTTFTTNVGTAGQPVLAIAEQSNGQVVVGGEFTSWAGTTVGRIVRLNSTGTRDTAFTTNNGTGVNMGTNSVRALLVDPTTQKIYVTGTINQWNGVFVNGLVRLNTDGTRDTSTSLPGTEGSSITIQSDGKILIGQYTGGYITRLNTSGTTDSSFSGGGNTSVNVSGIAVNPNNGNVLAALGLTLTSRSHSFLGYSQATRVMLFNSSGILLNLDGTIFEYFRKRQISMPYTKVDGVWKPVKAVYNKVSGAWKSSFLQGGIDDAGFFQGNTGPNNFVYVTVIQPDGKLLVGGNFTTWDGVTANGFVRLNADASIDTAFMTNVGTGGAGAGPSVQDIILNPDGSMVLGGTFLTWNGATSNYIVKLNSNGTRDTTFGTNIGTAANSTVWALERNPDGTIIAAGTFSTWNGTAVGRIVKLSAAGVRDTTFTTNNAGGITNGSTRGLAIDTTGAIIAGGTFTTYGTTPVTVNYIVKMSSVGTRDTTFTTNVGTTQNNNVYAIGVNTADNSLIIGGDFTVWGGVSVGRIVKVSSTGTRDTAFTTNNGTGFDGTVWTALQIDSAGRIMLGGFFTAFNGVSTPYIARLSSTGVREAMFTTNISGINIGVQGITQDNSGKAYIGGRFTTINGRTYNKFARIGAEATA